MKVYLFEIPKSKTESLTVQEDFSGSFYNKLHKHEEIQMTYIEKGSGKLVIWDTVHAYSEGDFIVIGSNCPHIFQELESNNRSHRISVFFNAETFGEDFFRKTDLEERKIESLFSHLKEGFKIINFQNGIGTVMKSFTRLNNLSRFVVFLELIDKICHAEKISLTSFVEQRNISNEQGQRMQKVLDFVLNNFSTDITLNRVAEIACMTPNAFCSYFKTRTNKTFFSFLLELRIEHACQLLKKKNELSIAQISSLVGFNSISHFNRKFKGFKGVSPTQYLNSF
ncbi:AraC family transcriptional regulator [Seonamhaeicola sp.]|uniref:helix-turn-helix domain-containing protein n=1 Tax=Seonamhaeicola sp. TaxID=1912245 RepID=UPI0026364C95|nr:AraC family transcriptional regulator [Seonamhaeicola sp.]